MTPQELGDLIVQQLNKPETRVVAARDPDHDDLIAIGTDAGDGLEVQVRVKGKVPSRSE